MEPAPSLIQEKQTAEPVVIEAVVHAREAKHLQAIDGLRGFAALLVVVYHLFDTAGKPEFRPWYQVNILRPLHEGWSGVDLFLVLSGFCLFLPFVRDPKRRINLVDFAQRRVKRILPAYYASLLLLPLLSYLVYRDARLLQNFGGVRDVTLHVLLLHSLNPATMFSYCPVYWSLGLEWLWYMIFPAAVWLFRRAGAIAALATLAAITITWRVGLYLYFGSTKFLTPAQVVVEPPFRDFVFGRLFEFGVGMFAAWYFINRTISKRMTLTCLILAPLSLIAANLASPIDPWLPVRHMLYGIAYACLLIAVISPVHTVGHRIFGGKFLPVVGEYSYSLYLFHLPGIYILVPILRQQGLSGSGLFFVSLLYIPLIMGVSKLAYLAFEKPFMGASSKRNFLPLVGTKPVRYSEG